MRSVVIVLAAIFAAVSADISHLSTSYLPPSASGTTIEKQELLELPEQIEYAGAGQQTNMGMMRMQMMPMQRLMPSYDREEMRNPSGEMLPHMTAAHYLPPSQIVAAKHHHQHLQQPHQQQHQQHQQQPQRYHHQQQPTSFSQQYLTPVMNTQHQQQPLLAMPMQSQSYMIHAPTRNAIVMPSMVQRQGSAASYYLPPSMMMQQIPEPRYQQYQEQLLRREQQMPQTNQLLNIETNPMEHQQPHQRQQQQMMQTMPEKILAAEKTEAEPAHILAEDGYHYKSGGGNDMRLQFIQ